MITTEKLTSISVIVFSGGVRIGQADMVRGFWELYRHGQPTLKVPAAPGGGIAPLVEALEAAEEPEYLPEPDEGWSMETL